MEMKYSNSMLEPKIGDVVEWEHQVTCSDQYGTWNCGSERKRGRLVALHPENKKSFEVQDGPHRTIRIAQCNLVHRSKSSESVVRSMLRDPEYREYLELRDRFADFERYLELKGKFCCL